MPDNRKGLLKMPRLRMGGKRSGRQKDLAKTVKQRELARVRGRFSFFRSQFMYRLYSVVPPRYRWLLPMLRDYLPGVAEAEAETTTAIVPDSLDSLPVITDDFLLPALPLGTEILGQRGRYRIEGLVNVRGRGRVYRGRQIGTEQLVSLREYLLPPRQFSPSESRLRQKSFRDRGGLVLADGRPERFRVMEPEDAIPDQKEPRCYLVDAQGIDLLPSLRTHLQGRSPWTAMQVWRFLNQILQTLESLHGQKFTVPAGQTRQGMVHGNLSLDSVLIDWPVDPAFAGDPQFLVYVTDLFLWESIFAPPGQESAQPTVTDDLVAVGRVAYRLLTGEPDDAAAGNPRQPEVWPAVQPQLKQYLFQLLGLRTPFPSAAAARQAIPTDWQLLTAAPVAESTLADDSSSPKTRWWRWLLAALLLGLLGGTLGWWLTRRQLAIASTDTPRLCCFQEAAGVPRGEFTYASDRAGLGDYVFRQKHLVFPEMTVEAAVETAYEEVQLTYAPMLTDAAAIAAVTEETADFALSALFGDSDQALLPLPANLQSQPIAHDAIAVFVAFSYEQRSQGLPQHLNGRLSFEEIRQLYTGQITNWRELGGPDLLVKLYVPSEPDMVALFEARVLQDPMAIAAFRQLVETQAQPSATSRQATNSMLPSVQVMRTFEILRAVIQDFEEAELGSIGFGPLSQAFGQCSVYPLALQADSGGYVQSIVRHEGAQGIDPGIDLCQDKGSYRRDYQAILTGQYPLAYPLEVIYPYDNSRAPIGRKVVEILQAADSQQQLERAGLVPIARNEEN